MAKNIIRLSYNRDGEVIGGTPILGISEKGYDFLMSQNNPKSTKFIDPKDAEKFGLKVDEDNIESKEAKETKETKGAKEVKKETKEVEQKGKEDKKKEVETKSRKTPSEE